MSMNGAPDLTLKLAGKAEGRRVVIIASSWHEQVMDGLINGAINACNEAGAEHILVRVPGSFELPLAALSYAHQGADAIVALGVVIRGGTPHFDYVCDAATRGLMDAQLTTRVPVGFGLLTCDNEEQAFDRAGLENSNEDKGYEAAQAAIAMIKIASRRR